MLEGKPTDASERVAHALASNPNSFWANAANGVFKVFNGHPTQGRAALSRAHQLSPHDASGALFPSVINAAYYFEHEYANTEAGTKRLIARYPEYPLPYRWLAAALGQLGLTNEAHEALGRALAISPQSFAAHVDHRPPWFRPEDYEHMLEGLRKAGWQG